MEQEERLALIRELCFIAVTRNEINTRRHRARYRKNYYGVAVRVLEAHNKSNAAMRRLEARALGLQESGHMFSGTREYLKTTNKKIAEIKADMSRLVTTHPKPIKWQKMGLMKLRSLELQGQGEYALAKHETMEHTIKTTERVKELVSLLRCFIGYSNGSITTIKFADATILFEEEINHYAAQHELNLAVTKMVEE